MRIYEINFKDIGDFEYIATKQFNDVQWKEYGIRAVNDETNEHYIFPYNSVYYVRVIDDVE